MNRQSRASGALAAIPLLLLVSLLPGTPGVAAEETDWATLVTDPELDAATSGTVTMPARDARVDLLGVDVKERTDSIVVRLRTREAAFYDPVYMDANQHTSIFGFEYLRKSDGQLGIFELVFQGEHPPWLTSKGGGASAELPYPETARPWSYELTLDKSLLFSDREYGVGDMMQATFASMQTVGDDFGRSQDRAPDVGSGASLEMVLAPKALHVQPVWLSARGPDYAAGPDVAVASDGTVHLSYMVYNGERGTSTGMYHGTIQGDEITGERIAAVQFPDDLHEDGRTRTAITVDGAGRPHVVFHPEPGGAAPGAARYAMRAGGDWTIEDPTQTTSGVLAIEDGDRAYPDVAVRGDRVLVLLQLAGDVAIVERTGADTWAHRETIDDARHGRLRIDADGTYHVAWFRATDASREVADGELWYKSENGAERRIGEGLEDYSVFWELRGTNGGFGFDVGPDGVPRFVWEDNGYSRSQRYGELRGDELTTEDVHLIPTHGNPQNTMDMAIDADGYVHVVSGYGGTDMYAMRAPEGGWFYEPIPRYDVFAAAVTPDGRVQIVHTEPHGGTTIGLAHTASRGLPGDPVFPGRDEESAPGPGLLLLLGTVGLMASLGTITGARTVADHRPRYALPLFAAVGGFSRLARDKMTEHKTRDQIVAAIEAAPGRTAAEIRADLGIPRGTFFYHLRRLEEEGLLKATRQGGQMWLHPYSAPAPVPHRAQAVLEVAQQHPGMTAREYADLLGWNHRTVHDHLQRLERMQELHRQRVNAREVRWVVGPDPTFLEAG